MTNEEYALSIGAKKETPAFERLMKCLASYGENKWWLSDNPKERAYYQTLEPVQVMAWEQYGRDLQVLLGRTPTTYEVVLDEFRQEVERAWRWGVGCASEEEGEQRSTENMLIIAEKYFTGTKNQ